MRSPADSPPTDLQRCPGISKRAAKYIVKERKFRFFIDWRDLKDRIKGIDDRHVEKLKDADTKQRSNKS